MIDFKSGQISKKEKDKINIILTEIVDAYSDFYITRNNLRLFIKDNLHLLWEALKNGDKIVFGEEGILFITGWSDKSDRKYVKILTNTEDNADKLLKILSWNMSDTDLYAKIKKESPIAKSLQKNGFKFKGDRGKEILLCKSKKIQDNKGE